MVIIAVKIDMERYIECLKASRRSMSLVIAVLSKNYNLNKYVFINLNVYSNEFTSEFCNCFDLEVKVPWDPPRLLFPCKLI